MYYFSNNGSKLNTNEYTYLNQGHNALVYQKDNTIFKQYYQNISPDERITKEMFNFLKSFNEKNLMKPYETYYYTKLKSLLSNLKDKQIDGYTAKFYQEDLSNAYKVEYLLESIYEIEKLFHLLKDNQVIINDINAKNSVITKDRIVIIDFDQFYFLKDNNFIKHYNAEQLDILINEKILSLMRCLIAKLTGLYHFDLFKGLEKEKNMTMEISKILKPYHNIKEMENR